MKKNVMMRVASLLMVCVLATTCGISGTFAKYVTSDNGSDSARVAHWGVTITATSEMFSETYDVGNTGEGKDGLGVKAEAEVVAPGTAKTDAMTFAVKGRPEVDGKITATKAEVTLTGWEVEGAYYCPLIVTVNGTKIYGLDSASMAEFKGEIEAAMKTAIEGTFEAGDVLDGDGVGDMSISWEWPFQGSGHVGGTGHADQTDAKDTKLGDAATKATIAFDVVYLIEQVD